MGSTPADLSTSSVLLDTAERMFSESGFDGVSLRELTRQAGTNIAAVNYHFGSKEKLFHAVIHRRIAPMNEQRLALLRHALQEAGDGKPALASLLDAFARPIVIGTGRAGHDSLRQILVRLFTAADPLVRPIIERDFVPVGRQFIAAIGRACPGLSEKELMSGFVFFLGSMINLLNRALIAKWEKSLPGEEETLRLLIQFGVAGFTSFEKKNPAAAAVRRRPR